MGAAPPHIRGVPDTGNAGGLLGDQSLSVTPRKMVSTRNPVPCCLVIISVRNLVDSARAFTTEHRQCARGWFQEEGL